MRIFLALMMMMGLLLPSAAQDEAAPWQAVVTGQIEAFRAVDGAAALALAGAGFRAQFAGQPEAFYAAILASGYAPVAQSRSHSFGAFTRLSGSAVVQVVLLVGPDQGLYEAVYRLEDEAGVGWRVVGVVLRKQDGIGI
jgi:hypothetical protein